jgi:hypothetical protein
VVRCAGLAVFVPSDVSTIVRRKKTARLLQRHSLRQLSVDDDHDADELESRTEYLGTACFMPTSFDVAAKAGSTRSRHSTASYH